MKIAAAFLLVMVFVLPAAAQDEPQNAINYCAGKLSYQLSGWGLALPTEYHSWGASARISNTSLGIQTQEKPPLRFNVGIVIGISAFRRDWLTEGWGLDSNADPVRLLNALLKNTNITPSVIEKVTSLIVQDQLGATAIIEYKRRETAYIAFEAGANTLAMVSLNTSTEITGAYKSFLLDIAETVRFEAPPFSSSNAVPLYQSFVSDNDCRMSFAYPASWSVLARRSSEGEEPFASIATFSETRSRYELRPGEAQIAFNIRADRGVGNEPYELSDSLDGFAEVFGYEIVKTTKMTWNGVTVLIGELRELSYSDEEPALSSALDIEIAYDEHVIASVGLFTAPGEVEQWRETAIAIAQSLHLNIPASE